MGVLVSNVVVECDSECENGVVWCSVVVVVVVVVVVWPARWRLLGSEGRRGGEGVC